MWIRIAMPNLIWIQMADWQGPSQPDEINAKKFLTACPCRTVGDHQDALIMWMKTPTTSPWMKQLTWLRIVHSGDWCPRLTLCSGACQWMMILTSLFMSVVCCQVPRGHVWLEGDNSENSADSRTYGPVPYGLLRSRVLYKVKASRSSAFLCACCFVLYRSVLTDRPYHLTFNLTIYITPSVFHSRLKSRSLHGNGDCGNTG